MIKALLQSVAGDRIMDITEQICAQQFGREPVLVDSLGEVRTRTGLCGLSPHPLDCGVWSLCTLDCRKPYLRKVDRVCYLEPV